MRSIIYRFSSVIIRSFFIPIVLLGMVSASAFANNKTVLVLGDSLSAAYNLAPEQGWVGLFIAKAQRENLPVKVVNASVSGATTAAGLQLLPAALAEHHPDIVVLELGANDGLQGKPLKYIRRNLERLIQLCKKSNAEILLLGIRVPPNYGDAYALPFHKQFTELAEAHNLAHVPFFLEGVAGNEKFMMADGLHPNEDGQAKVFVNIWPALEALIANK